MQAARTVAVDAGMLAAEILDAGILGCMETAKRKGDTESFIGRLSIVKHICSRTHISLLFSVTSSLRCIPV